MFREGQQIGSYTLIRKLGRGGFGEVWLAERKSKFVTTKVAVKLPHDEQVDHEAIKSEAILWEQASGHPNVLPIIDADEYDGQIVIVSEYAPDGSLEELIDEVGTLSIRRAIEFTIGILRGLEFLHSRKIIHRDIKPANILLQGDTPRLADFGISRVMKTTSVSVNIGGTPVYMAPEAFDRKRTAQTDIWSVGVILYQMLKGSLPFPYINFTDLLGALFREEPQPFPESIPIELQKIVLKALAKKPEERYQTARDMRKDLADFLIRISQQTIEPTVINNQLAETFLPYQQLNKTEASSISDSFNSLATPKERDINQTQASPTMKSPNPAPNIGEEGLGKSYSFNEILELPKIKFQRKSKYRIVKILLPAAVLILLIAGGLFYLIYKQQIKESETSNQITEQSPNPNQTTEQTSSINEEALKFIPYRKGDKFGVIDINRNVIVEPKYDFMYPFSEGFASVMLRNKAGFIDQTGKAVIPMNYDRVFIFSEGIARVAAKGKWGAIDKLGNEVIPIKFEELHHECSEGLIGAKQNGKWGFVDTRGNIIVPFVYESINDFGENLAAAKLKGKWGFIDKSNRVVIPFKYENRTMFREGLGGVSLNNKWGYIDKTEALIIPFKYDSINSFSDGLAGVRLNNKYGFIDRTGKEIIPFKYDDTTGFSAGFAPVKFNGKWGIINKVEEVIVPFKYKEMSFIFDGLSLVKLKNKDFWIDVNGMEYYEP